MYPVNNNTKVKLKDCDLNGAKVHNDPYFSEFHFYSVSFLSVLKTNTATRAARCLRRRPATARPPARPSTATVPTSTVTRPNCTKASSPRWRTRLDSSRPSRTTRRSSSTTGESRPTVHGLAISFALNFGSLVFKCLASIEFRLKKPFCRERSMSFLLALNSDWFIYKLIHWKYLEIEKISTCFIILFKLIKSTCFSIDSSVKLSRKKTARKISQSFERVGSHCWKMPSF